MNGTRSSVRHPSLALLIVGSFAINGCGPHPEEGILKLTPRKREVQQLSRPSATKRSSAVKKTRGTPAEIPVGK
jgi:hypothetical protein